VSNLDRSWLTIAQAAAATGRSERTIRRWITSRRLGHLELDGTRDVNERRLLELERATRQAARAGRPGARVNVHIVDALRSGGLSSPESGPRPPRRGT
jgi:excisionase family DNA binding protein